MKQPKARNSALSPIRQLLLPFPEAEPKPLHLPTHLVSLHPHQIWANLPLATQMGVRHTLQRVFQEVLNDRSHS
jgi:hypothetical protein